MIRFLFLGLWRDPGRSRLPLIVVMLGAALTVTIFNWINGIMGQSLEMGARLNTGHVRVTTEGLWDEDELLPVDLSLEDADQLLAGLQAAHPEMSWAERIRSRGLIDIPDSLGETRSQAPVQIWGLDLLTSESREIERLQLSSCLVRGSLPQRPGHALLSEYMAQRLDISTGQAITLFGQTRDGALAFGNLSVCGTIDFGIPAVDYGALMLDISDLRKILDMEDAATEILGFFPQGGYRQRAAERICLAFNQMPSDGSLMRPVMTCLSQQGGLADFLQYTNEVRRIMMLAFVLAMSLVLWNSGLMSGLRRYGEFGVRLAMGEEPGHIYLTLIVEAAIIGLVGSALGTGLGLVFSYYLQAVGVDLGGAMSSGSLMLPRTVRAAISWQSLYLGFFPGLISVFLGSLFSGWGIFKRQTAQLFRELEV